MYSVKEIYYTIQGEGFHTGRSAVFLRFTGCNLWTGHEKDRSKAICNFCDTDFVGVDGPGGGKFENASLLAKHAISFWPKIQTLNLLLFALAESHFFKWINLLLKHSIKLVFKLQ